MDMEAIQHIARGISSGNVVSLGYVDSKGMSSIRKVEPYMLDVNANKLMAHCLEKQAIRHFKLNKVTFAEVLGEKYIPRYDTSIQGVNISEEE